MSGIPGGFSGFPGQQPGGFPGAPPPPAAGAPPPGGSTGGVRHIGNGYYYDETSGLLTTPQRGVMEWRPGQPLPGGFGGMPAAGGSGFPGWGQMPTAPSTPVSLGDDPRFRALEDELKASREQIREEARRREAADMKAAFEKSIVDTNARFETLIAKLTDKPTGPSASEEALRREVEKMRQEQESRAREDALRAEMRANQDRFDKLIHEIQANKSDPMVTMLSNLMSLQQSSANTNAQTQRDTAIAQLDAAKENTRLMAERFGSAAMTPERMIELIKLSKDNSANGEAMKGAIDMYKNLFSMSQDVLRMQGEMYQGSQDPAWVGPLQQVVDRLGQVAAVYVKQKGENAAPRPNGVPRQQPQQHQQHQPQQPQQPTPGRPSSVEHRDAVAAQHFKRPTNGAAVAAAARVAAASAPVQAPAPAAAPARRRRQAPVGAPVSPAQALANANTGEVENITSTFDDETFFGIFLGKVNELRGSADTQSPAQVANFIMQAQQYAAAANEVPPAIELLVTGHIEIVVGRLIPGAPDPFRAQVAAKIREAMNMPGGSGGSEEEEDEGDGDGDGDGGEPAAAQA